MVHPTQYPRPQQPELVQMGAAGGGPPDEPSDGSSSDEPRDRRPPRRPPRRDDDRRDEPEHLPDRGPPGGDPGGGPPGWDGHDSRRGRCGPPGRDGQDGEDGQPGRDGQDGEDGHPGWDGRRGPHGYPGPGYAVPAQATAPAATGNVTLDTTGLENSFQVVGQAIGNLAQQQMANTALSWSLIKQRRERATFGHVLNQRAAGQKQSQYNDLFKHIPVYDGEDKDQFLNWLDTLKSACAYS